MVPSSLALEAWTSVVSSVPLSRSTFHLESGESGNMGEERQAWRLYRGDVDPGPFCLTDRYYGDEADMRWYQKRTSHPVFL